MRKEFFRYSETAGLLRLLDEAARRSGVSRGQAFDDFLHMGVCALSGGQMEEQYLAVVDKHTQGKPGQRGCDILSRLFGELVAAMETTADEVRDVLGDLFEGAITYGENGQYLTPLPLTNLMAQLTAGNEIDPDEQQRERRAVCDPCCGSGRMLLAVAQQQPHWEFYGQDVDLRCVRMTTINLSLRNLYGYVIWGNSLALEQKLVYRTGFNLHGFVREIPLGECPPSVRQVATEPPLPTRMDENDSIDSNQRQQLRLF